MTSRTHPFLGITTSSLNPSVTLTTNTPSPDLQLRTLSTSTQLTFPPTGYDNPKIRQTFRPSQSPDAASLHFLGFQCSEFALPIRASSTSLHFNFFNRPSFTRPHSVLPLLILSRKVATCTLLAPIDAFHEQVLAVENDALHWGWSGDLTQIPPNFSTTLAIITAESPREALSAWGHLVRHAARANHCENLQGRYADVCVAKLSYWTDNGSAYWYRREPGTNTSETLEQTISTLQNENVPVASVELDSWFYPHQLSRRVADVGYLQLVPPTGLIAWTPRADVLPNGVSALRARLGNRPLILHNRHISSESEYLNYGQWWIDGARAHPKSDWLFRIWMQQAADWGATAYEQDWLVEVWLGVRQLRERVGRVARWQHQLDDAAKERDVALIWCMATPADMAHAVSLRQIVAIRSCDDYRYADDPSTLWRWHLTVSCILRSLGFYPFKDVFMTHDNESGVVDINGDPNFLLEACLAALSAGPVGIGDRMGRTNSKVVAKCCRVDGVLIKPDVPMAALDRSLRDDSSLLWADTHCGMWRYIVVIRTGIKASGDIANNVPLEESLEIGKGTLVYNWRTKETFMSDHISAALCIHEWEMWVICPVFMLSSDIRFSLIGDRNVFATMGDRRIRIEQDMVSAITEDYEGHKERDDENAEGILETQNHEERIYIVGSAGMAFHVLGASGETVEVTYWSEQDGVDSKTVQIPDKGWIRMKVQLDEDSGKVKVIEE